MHPRGLRRGPRRTRGYAQPVLEDIAWVYRQVCDFARDFGVAVPEDQATLKLHLSDRPATAKRQPMPLAVCVRVAERLHVVHQAALWLLRLCGVRLSEGFGIRVRDLVDLGPGHAGIMRIQGEGGRTFTVRSKSTARFAPRRTWTR